MILEKKERMIEEIEAKLYYGHPTERKDRTGPAYMLS